MKENARYSAFIVRCNEGEKDTFIKADIEWTGTQWDNLRVDTDLHPHLKNVTKFGFSNVLIDCLNPTESKN